MQTRKPLKVGIGFATGRKSFQKVLRSYIHNWKESGLVDNEHILLNIFVAYDLTYNKTKKKDYINTHPELAENIDGAIYIGRNDLFKEIAHLVRAEIITTCEAQRILEKGYASQRNAILYSAIKYKMDYLVFLDDDEYPLAVTNTHMHAVWAGQHVLATHINYLRNADITHGYHCGYISPIPFIEYNSTLTESCFRTFIEAISNDILNWAHVKKVMNDGGVTYANTTVLTEKEAFEVQEINHAKFISGANLGLNLTDPRRIFPFYNPKGARGEDTFLSTCLQDRHVLRIPCYTFHDGFSTYKNLLEGVLPIRMKYILADDEQNIQRFYKACIGWIRYKPLLVYCTQPQQYDEIIKSIRSQLLETLPKICAYFDRPEFLNILIELEKYHKNVKKHHRDFFETQRIWAKIMDHFAEKR